jgi:hypothetical protein
MYCISYGEYHGVSPYSPRTLNILRLRGSSDAYPMFANAASACASTEPWRPLRTLTTEGLLMMPQYLETTAQRVIRIMIPIDARGACQAAIQLARVEVRYSARDKRR